MEIADGKGTALGDGSPLASLSAVGLRSEKRQQIAAVQRNDWFEPYIGVVS